MSDDKKNDPVEEVDYQKQAEENLEGWQRAKADYANLVKRTAQERTEIMAYACADFVLKLIPVIDNFKNATRYLPKDLENNEWAKGVLFIQKQLEAILTEAGVTEYGQEGDKFDPTIHEAIEDLSKDKEDEKVIQEVVCAGYKMGEKIIRVAKVKVGSK